mgnify:CR=1 FL=1
MLVNTEKSINYMAKVYEADFRDVILRDADITLIVPAEREFAGVAELEKRVGGPRAYLESLTLLESFDFGKHPARQAIKPTLGMRKAKFTKLDQSMTVQIPDVLDPPRTIDRIVPARRGVVIFLKPLQQAVQ